MPAAPGTCRPVGRGARAFCLLDFPGVPGSRAAAGLDDVAGLAPDNRHTCVWFARAARAAPGPVESGFVARDRGRWLRAGGRLLAPCGVSTDAAGPAGTHLRDPARGD